MKVANPVCVLCLSWKHFAQKGRANIAKALVACVKGSPYSSPDLRTPVARSGPWNIRPAQT